MGWCEGEDAWKRGKSGARRIAEILEEEEGEKKENHFFLHHTAMAVEESSELASAVAAASSLKASAALVAEERAVAAEAVTAAAPMTTAGTTATTTASAILQKVQRDLNRLHDPASDRTTKRRALEALARETVGRADGVDDATAPLAAVNVNGMEDAAIVVREVFSGVHKELLRTMADPVEKCRELAVHVLGGYVMGVHVEQSGVHA